MDVFLFTASIVGAGVCVWWLKSGAIVRWADELKAKAKKKGFRG